MKHWIGRIAMVLVLMCGMGVSVVHAAPSAYCPTLTASVASGGSVLIDVSNCDGPLNITFGSGTVSPPPSHGTAVLSIPAPDGSQTVEYTNNGDGATSDSFYLEDEDAGIVTINITVGAPSGIAVTPASLALQTGAAFSQQLSASGGAAPYSYTVSAGALPAGLTLSASGLLSGTPQVRGNYSFTVRATDNVSASGAKSYAGTIANPNMAFSPSTITLTLGAAINQQVTVSGGVAPYTFTLNTGASMPPGLSLSSSGLITGSPSAVGSSTVSIVINESSTVPGDPNNDWFEVENLGIVVTAATAPGAPTIGAATPGNAQAAIAFTAPASDGGSPITGYIATCMPGNVQGTGGAADTSITVTGMTNGTAYSCSVAATNAVGTGVASGTVSVTPVGPPGAPTIGTATPGNGQASIAFTAPASNGGSAITGYTATCMPGNLQGTGGAAATSIVVGGMTNGTTYNCSVTASNTEGTSSASGSVNVTPASTPGAPTIGAATPGNGQASIAFTAPASNGGSAITGYIATCMPGNLQGTGGAAATLINVTGMTNGTAYSCSVTATNAIGAGAASGTVSVTPVGPPGAPTMGTATPGNGQAIINFTAPASNGGSAITGYTATCMPGNVQGTGGAAATSITVTGLTNGTAYSCAVTASNAQGAGSASGSVNVTPGTVPGAPTIGAATPGNGQASIAFTAPASNGGSAITGYTATCMPGNVQGTGGAAATSINVTGMTNGTAYSCSVTATNAIGAGAASGTVSVTPVGPPGAPTMGTATPGNGQAIINFTAPASNGGSAITGYTATCMPGNVQGSGGAAATSITVTGLTNGTAYSCSVTASNAHGSSAASNAVSVTPARTVFSGPSPSGGGTITASFTGGGAACNYGVAQFIPVSGHPSSPPAGSAPAGAVFSHGLFDFTTTGCTPGSTISMTITYPTSLPAGSQYYKYGPTPGNPTPHWYVLPASISGNVAQFAITDGGLGDDDLAANGAIIDQGGPAMVAGASPIPTLSQWAMLLLSALMGALALRRLAMRGAF